ncbi:MAG TPA: CpsD/CapB family tyrosine-protein kinase [Bryobacteraceae bacterium]|nr:CpsD/CapB family tyrosine-protein kinase [Bryobacteraceae bacterium]
MSRVHDALRRAEQAGMIPEQILSESEPLPLPAQATEFAEGPASAVAPAPVRLNVQPGLLSEVVEVPFHPAPESHLLDLNNSHETPAEEFRTLRTRLNHLQTLQPLHTIVVTSPSPAEGKTFTAVNLALAESQLAESSVLLGDFDLRRPIVHNLFQIDRAPGLSDYLTGQCTFAQALRRIEGMNLYMLPAGSPVKNPLELLNMRQAKLLFEDLPRLFSWAIFDTPPLLFSADANLLATMADGTVLVVKIGATTFDNVTRAMQSLCENNVLGIVANGARASELYSKYTYYYSKAE